MDDFDQMDYALGLIQTAITEQKDISLTHETAGKLFVVPVSGEFYSDIPNVPEFFRTPASEFTVTEMSVDEVLDLSLRPGTGRNVDELMWQAAFYASDGRLLKGLSPEDVIYLNRWPNLTKLPNTYNTFQLAALLTRHFTTIAFAGKVLGVHPMEVHGFYTAAYCAGFVEIVNTPSENMQEDPNAGDDNLLSRILHRISSI